MKLNFEIKSKLESQCPVSSLFIDVHDGRQPTGRVTAAYISESSRNSKELKQYDPPKKIKWLYSRKLYEGMDVSDRMEATCSWLS